MNDAERHAARDGDQNAARGAEPATPVEVDDLLAGGDDVGLWAFLARAHPDDLLAPDWLKTHVATRRAHISPTPPQRHGLLVWDLDATKADEVRSSHPDQPVFGIIDDVWPSIVCRRSRSLEIRHEVPDDRRYAILCTPRVGSTYLCELLSEAKIGSPREHVRSFFNGVCRRGRRFDELMDRMRAHGGQAGFFGTKLISHYVFDSVHGPNWQTRLADWLVGNEFKLILLRRDVVDSTISAYFAQRTSIWHVRNASLTDAFDAVQYDRDRLLEMHSGFTEGATRLEAFAGRLNDVLVIDYADLVMDADVVVRSIAQFVGAAPPNRRLRSDLIRVSAEVPLMQRYRAQLAEDLRRRS